MKKLLFLISEDSYFCSHRLNLAKTAQQAGYQVALATRCRQHGATIQATGITLFPLRHFTRTGLNPIQQLLSLWELYRVYKNFKPTVVHHVAIKPVIFGSMIAFWCKVPRIINALGGLGYLFTPPNQPTRLQHLKKQCLRYLSIQLFTGVFKNPRQIVLLQNPNDKETLLQLGCINPAQIRIIAGSGVDPDAFPLRPEPPTPPMIISCMTRLLWDKGLGELVAAATMLKQRDPSIQVRLYGAPDPKNPSSISEETVLAWHHAQIIDWRGYCADVAKAYADCHIAVLPSYREGLPKSLLEAASVGRPIVTTDVPGCREVVTDGENGFLVPAKDAVALAEALWCLSQSPQLREQMGHAGRVRVETTFSDRVIHREILALYNVS